MINQRLTENFRFYVLIKFSNFFSATEIECFGHFCQGLQY